MKGYIYACVTALLVSPAMAGDAPKSITLLHGHPIHHKETHEAGIAMGLSIAGGKDSAPQLVDVCRELQHFAKLPNETDDGLELSTLFIVPYKEMAVEGYFLPADGSFGSRALVKGKRLGRSTIDRVVVRAGIPTFVLDETNVELEISCQLDEPLWTITWQDIRAIGDQEPDVAIEQARLRFMTVYRKVSRHAHDTRKSAAELNSRARATDRAGTSAASQ